MPNIARAFALLGLAALTTCGSPPPSALDLYHQDQIRQGKVAPPAEAAGTCEPIAIARLPVDCANDGTKLTVNCATHGEIAATTHSMPFFDPDKKRRTAQG